jgi:AraC-like DNA-binding protein
MTYYMSCVQALTRQLYSGKYQTKQVIAAKRYIDEHYAGAICLDDLARKFFISKFRFLRLFRSLYGTTPHQYLTTVRIKHARLLLNQQYTVTDTCLAVGFSSTTSFATLFKKYTGCAPATARKKSEKQFSIAIVPRTP